MGTAALPEAVERALPLLAPEHRPSPEDADVSHGWLDLLGSEAPASTGRAQDLMLTRGLPVVYEKLWRPAWGRLLTAGTSTRDEHRIARLLLGLVPGDGILDVACGPGNFTREFARIVGEHGLAVGIDASESMLTRAVRDTPEGEVAYVRGDAVQLPFRDHSFDAVCCFAALHLFADPGAALDNFARVLTPGGRVAIFTSCRLSSVPGRTMNQFVGARSGMRIFGRDEILDALSERGFVDAKQKIAGFTQFVGARKGVSSSGQRNR